MKVLVVGGFLGAGKTSAIRSLARVLSARGERVAVITNDQGHALVDTELVGPAADWVREIGGGCFCCRYDALETALGAVRDAGASYVIAEAVGSCTDLVATVLSPLAERAPDRFELAPLAVVVDPWRVRDVATGAFSDDVAYLYRKQIEEADVVVLSRADLGPPDVANEIRVIAPHAATVRISSVTGAGISDWLAARPSRPAAPLVLDYDRYAAAEASLGWLNARALVEADHTFAPASVLNRFFEALRALPIAHLKIAVERPSRGSAAVVRRGGDTRLELEALPDETRELAIVVNARVALPPAELEARVRSALVEAAENATHRFTELACFEPGRPVPVHRYTYRCGSGDDASCCAAFYGRPDVRYLLGDSFHPGGTRLTLALAKELVLPESGDRARARVLDVACGRGTSLRAVVDAFPVGGVGLDTGAEPSSAAHLVIVRGDAHAIPFDAQSFDGAMCECALSTFADPRRVLAEIARVLRPGRRVAVSDMIVEGPVPEALRPYAHTGACLSGARTRTGWTTLFEEAGFGVVLERDESDSLRAMVSGMKQKLLGVALAKASGLLPADVDIDVVKGRALLKEAKATVDAGNVRYGAWILARSNREAGR